MKRFLSITALILATIFVACSDDTANNGNPNPQPIEVVAPTDVQSSDGVERVKLSWKQSVEAEIAKSIIYWNERQSSKTITFKAQSTSGTQKDSIYINKLDEGDYTFEIVNVDKQNNQSVFKSITAHAYGDDYIAELETRPVEELTYDKESHTATIVWSEGWEKGLGSEVKNDSEDDDAPATVWVKNSDLTTAISPLNDGAKLTVQTLYCPDNCLDTMRSAAVTLVVRAPEEEEGGDDVEETRPLTEPTNIKSYDGFKRVKLSWEQTVESSVEKTRIIWGLTEDQMYEKVFERTEQSGSQKEEIIIDLPEGEYTFSIVNVNKAGDTTEAKQISARAYGDTYLATLTTRAVDNLTYNFDKKLATFTLGTANSAGGMVNSHIRYKHTTSGEEIIKSVGNRNVTIECDNIGPGEKLELSSNYCPENCIDTMQSAIVTRTTDHIVDVKVMQFNVKNESTSLESRCNQIADLIKTEEVDVIGLQELYCGLNSNGSEALNKLLTALGSNYEGILYQRTASFLDYEGEAIVYRKDKFSLISSGRFWLTSTPDTAGKTSVDGYNAKYERFAIWSVLKDIATGEEICFTTTHIDNSNSTNDENAGFPVMTYQVGVLVNNVQARSGSVDDSNNLKRPIIIVGDFNANPDKKPISTMKQQKYSDTYDLAKTKNYPEGGQSARGTMHDNEVPNYSAFDYVFTRSDNCTVFNHTIHPAKRNSVILSDHLAVTVELRYQLRAE